MTIHPAIPRFFLLARIRRAYICHNTPPKIEQSSHYQKAVES